MADIEVEWYVEHSKGGAVRISDTGLAVYTDCHGCGSEETTDVEKLVAIRDGLDDLLYRLRGHRG